MSAPKGNRFWEQGPQDGRPVSFKSPDEVWERCVEYFEWNEANPLYEGKVAQSNGKPTVVYVAKMRAMTIEGLCHELGIGVRTWYDYRDKEEFSQIITRVDNVLRRQKFEGASAGLLNPNIIARDLGLKDVTHTDHSSSDGTMTPLPTKEISIDEMEALVAGAARRIINKDGAKG